MDFRKSVALAAVKANDLYEQSYNRERNKYATSHYNATLEACKLCGLEGDNFAFWIVWQLWVDGAEPFEAAQAEVKEEMGE